MLRAPNLNLWSLRVEKTFGLGSAGRASFAVDVLNLLNEDAFYSVASTTLPTATTPPAYLQGTTFVPPRRANLVFKYWF